MQTHALYVTCVELLGLPISPQAVANQLIEVVLKGLVLITYEHIHQWINAIGLIISSLPESYWSVLYDRLEEIFKDPQMVNWSYRQSPFDVFSFSTVQRSLLENKFVMILALSHSVFHHFNVGQAARIVKFIRNKIIQHVKTEQQLIYLLHVIGPFLQRFEQKDLIEMTKIFYELLEQIDHSRTLHDEALVYMDNICDFFYHIKYMFVGDAMKTELEPIIRRLSNPLRLRLRFISRLNVEEIHSDQQTIGSQQGQNSNAAFQNK